MSNNRMGRPLTIEQVKAKHERQWISLDGVQGVGIGEAGGKPVITVYVVQNTPSVKQHIPSEVEGYPVRVEAMGDEFHAFPT